MNKILYTILILLVIGFTACEVEEGEYNNGQTLQGRIAFATTSGFIDDEVMILDLITRVDLYAQSPEDQKSTIKKYYLREYEIIETNRTWILKSEVAKVELTHNGKSANEVGAIWTTHITFNDNPYTEIIVKDDNFRLECIGDKKWNIKTKDMPRINSFVYNTSLYYKDEKNTGEFIVKGNLANDKSPNLYDFNIESGAGRIAGLPVLEYEIKETLSYFYISNSYYPIVTLANGVLAIKADNTDDIKVKISITDLHLRYMVTFNGVTEDWDRNYYY